MYLLKNIQRNVGLYYKILKAEVEDEETLDEVVEFLLDIRNRLAHECYLHDSGNHSSQVSCLLLFLFLTPYTLHVTPYSLNLISFTLYPFFLTPYTLHLTPYSLLFTPNTVYTLLLTCCSLLLTPFTPYTLHLTPYSLLLISYSLHLTP